MMLRRLGGYFRNCEARIVLAILASVLGVTPAFAQVTLKRPFATSIGGRLTLNPRKATAKIRPTKAGEHLLDSLPGYIVYVPQACVGPKRCPLYVFFDGGDLNSRDAIDRQRPVADKYGMILLAPEATAAPGRWGLMDQFFAQSSAGTLQFASPSVARDSIDTRPADQDTKNLDAALKTVIHTYAVDPNKIAVSGMSLGGAYTFFLGQANRDIFSRVAVLSPSVYYDEWGPRNPKTEFLFVAGLMESSYMLPIERLAVAHLRAQGTPVKHMLLMRPHENRAEDYDYVGRWLIESWRKPVPAPYKETPAVTSIHALRDDTFRKCASFWPLFFNEPDSIRNTIRMAHQTELVIPVSGQRMATLMMDMPALAAASPAVAADLAKVGLTAQEEQACRVATISARAAIAAGDTTSSTIADPVLAANIAFLVAHAGTIDLRLWTTP